MSREKHPGNPWFLSFVLSMSARTPFNALCAVLASISAPFCRFGLWHTFGRVEPHVGILLIVLGSILARCCFSSVLARTLIRKAPAENRRHLQRRRSSSSAAIATWPRAKRCARIRPITFQRITQSFHQYIQKLLKTHARGRPKPCVPHIRILKTMPKHAPDRLEANRNETEH